MRTIKEFIAQLFAEGLATPNVAPDEDFFALGGQSLAAAVLVTKVEGAYGIHVSLAEFMSRASIEGFSGVVAQRCLEAAR